MAGEGDSPGHRLPLHSPAMTGDTPEGRSSQTQRVRVGMIGLACVFLLVMLVTALVSLGGGRAADNLSQRAAANESTPREPLAELGVAPGASGDSAAPATPQTVRPTGR